MLLPLKKATNASFLGGDTGEAMPARAATVATYWLAALAGSALLVPQQALAESPSWRDLAQSAFERAAAWSVAGYEHAPVLMIGLALVAAVPVLALVGWLMMLGAGRGEAALRDAAEAGRPGDGHIRLEGEAQPFPISGELIRIGRQEDNELCISDATVQSYHAMIRRSPECDFVITDISDRRGRGVRVNGRRIAEARLAHGDRIELGDVRLSFEMRPH